MSERITILVNEAPREIGAPATVVDLATELGFAGRKGVALAINGAVVPRAAWDARSLSPGDRVLVIRATQGG